MNDKELHHLTDEEVEHLAKFTLRNQDDELNRIIDKLVKSEHAAVSTIEGLKERNKPLDDKLIQEIAEKCTDLNKYDDDDFTPPESVPGDDDEEFWDWIQDLLRTSAKNALGMVSDGIFSEVEGLKGEVERLNKRLASRRETLLHQRTDIEQLRKELVEYDESLNGVRNWARNEKKENEQLWEEVKRYKEAMDQASDILSHDHKAYRILQDSLQGGE